LFWLIAGALAIVFVAALAQVGAGSYGMTWNQSLAAVTDAKIWGHPATLTHFLLGQDLAKSLGFGEPGALPTMTLIVWNVRMPRVLVGIMVGINLAFSGSIFQAITRNEMASPYLLGVSSGAGLAILVVLVLCPVLGPFLPLIAMLGGGGAFLLVYLIAWNRGTSSVRLVLAGVIVGAIAGSLHTALFLFAKDISIVQNALAWTTGSLTGVGWEQVRMVTPWTVVCVVLGLSGSRYLDVLLLGDATAKSLGMSVERVRFLLAATAILAATSSVSVTGLVGFVGLIVPHVVRSIVGSRHHRMLVGCLFAGPALLTSADAVARLALCPVQIPVGIVTGVIGGVFFLYLMRRRREFGKL
jgi:iron complex transport system permease protein